MNSALVIMELIRALLDLITKAWRDKDVATLQKVADVLPRNMPLKSRIALAMAEERASGDPR